MIAVVAASIPVVKVFEKPPTPTQEIYQVEVTQEESEIEEYEIELSEESAKEELCLSPEVEAISEALPSEKPTLEVPV